MSVFTFWPSMRFGVLHVVRAAFLHFYLVVIINILSIKEDWKNCLVHAHAMIKKRKAFEEC